MKLGIFGGTFNPPHIGHLIVAEHVRAEQSLDKIIFIPAANPPHKMSHEIVAPSHRVAMLRLAIEHNPNFDISEMEITRGGVSFTIDTLRQLQQGHPADQLFLLIGMDNLMEFHTWKSPNEILNLATVVVMTRPGFDARRVPEALRSVVRMCDVPEIEVASRSIRARVAEGKSIRYLVTTEVEDYITKNRLYSDVVSVAYP